MGKAKATLAIGGMTCGSCVSAVTNALEALDGVENVAISLVTERGRVDYDPNKVETNELVEAVEDAGFDGRLLQVDSDEANVQDGLGGGESVVLETVAIQVYGMTCSACTGSVETTLRAIPGVKSAVVALATEEATVVYDKTVLAGPRVLIDAVKDTGFDAVLAKSLNNEQQIEALSRVNEISQYRRSVVISLIFAIPVFVLSMLVPGVFPFLRFLKIRLFPGLYLDDVINFFLTLPVQFGVGGKIYKNAYKAISHGAPTMDVLVCLSTSSAFFFSCLSVLVAVLMPSTTGDSGRPSTLWDTATMLVTFVTIGKYLENRAKGQTSVALSRLISLVPDSAIIYANPADYDRAVADNAMSILEEKIVSTDLIQPGDIVVLRPGEKVAADGVVLKGSTHLSESHITGESLPVAKSPGDRVLGGSVNGPGRIDFRVESTGEDTKLAHIVRLVQDAQTSRAPVQRFADYIAGYFVPTVLLLGVGTFCTWMTILHFVQEPPKMFAGSSFMACLKLCISVIVVACPCALGLATPTAVMVGTGVGAGHGILIKGGATLETTNSVDIVLFDKTGTLTTGNMSVTRAEIPKSIAGTINQTLWWVLVGLLESSSEHPVADALVRRARQECGLSDGHAIGGGKADVNDFSVHIGEGVKGQVIVGEGVGGSSGSTRAFEVIAGSRSMLERYDVKGVGESTEIVDVERAAGETVIHVGIDGVYAGWVALADTVKPEAALAVTALKRLGLDVGLVTGDNAAAATKVAAEVGIPPEMIWSGVSPSGKIDLVRNLQGQLDSSIGNDAHRVAMVGDGINDSPALAAAAVGISMSGATDVAMETADIVLLRENALLDVAAAIELSRKTFHRIKVNLIWALVYNIVMIPFAMGVFLPFGIMLHPMVAGAAMAMSSVSVVGSSLLLQTWRPPTIDDADADADAFRTSKGSPNFFMDRLVSPIRRYFSRRPTTGGDYEMVSTNER